MLIFLSQTQYVNLQTFYVEMQTYYMLEILPKHIMFGCKYITTNFDYDRENKSNLIVNSI